MDPFKDYPTSAFNFRGDLVKLPAAPVPRNGHNVKRHLRDVLLDEGGREIGNCSKCTSGTKFDLSGSFNHRAVGLICTVCGRVDLWPVAGA